MEETKKCDGRCETCDINQRTYCCAQRMYYLMGDISAIRAQISHLFSTDNKTIIIDDKMQENENKCVIPPHAEEVGENN